MIGEHVITHSGEAKPIKWIGVGKVLATRGQRSAATPVIVRKGALGLNVPTQDLRVTKGHALYIDGVLIPVEELINHRSIFGMTERKRSKSTTSSLRRMMCSSRTGLRRKAIVTTAIGGCSGMPILDGTCHPRNHARLC